ncbi:hypothetical protein DSECCO2_387280 [anaerobic digester metagenome]
MTVFVLYFTVTVRVAHFDGVIIGNTQTLLLFTPFGGDEYDSVGSAFAIKRRSGSAFENCIVFNIKRVDIGNAISPVHAPADIVKPRIIVKRYIVDHNQRLVVAGEVVVAADYNACGAAFNAVALRYLHPCTPAGQGTDYIGR